MALFFAHRAFAKSPEKARLPLLASLLLASFFVIFQGYEWVSLIQEGLTMVSSSHGSFFYLIIGTHALHTISAIGLLFYVFMKLRKGTLVATTLWTAEVFWYFVVGIWPILYWQVYL